MSKVSIIIPVYNVEQYLKQCLDSVVNQTLKDIEIICINDCSSDNSLKILEEYASKDDRIRIINNDVNIRQGASRNKGIKIATSEYIMFVDSDDWLELNACEKAYNQIFKNNNDIVAFGIAYYFENLPKHYKNQANMLKKFDKVKNKQHINVSQLDINFLNNAECVYKIYNRSFLIKNKIYFTNGYYEDNLFNLKLFVYLNSMSILDKILYNYRKRSDSVTVKPDNAILIFDKLRECMNFLQETEIKNKQLFVVAKLVNCINTCMYRYRTLMLDMANRIKFYSEMRKFYKELADEHDISAIIEYIDHKNFKKILKYNFFMYEFLNFLSNIFSIKGETKNGIKRKVVTIFGIKFKMKK